MAKIRVTDKQVTEWNRDLRELEEIMDDIKTAEAAKVGGTDTLMRRCVECRENIIAKKNAYSKGKA